ncbi:MULTISPECIES: SGNH/GDSL hydrolase family protein [unclassified Solwaraspora]|uniref:SGNH/GDSL hydrolase family protein n=1 Tax=unclassified Solwaraspora TaxID=2627926 RepID=UPI00259B22A2|nr:SGNH/GDSL hydrolase family protein [Solwaraspora sp. WMMA2056]WJK39514.1 SGNH/GDSL hydrolase family protein [Solwaraspora sp. WMMA2056]
MILNRARHLRRTLTLSVSAALLITIAAAPATANAAGTTGATSATDDRQYVALGDSYSSGVGAKPYIDDDCKRSTHSYAAQYAAAHPTMSFGFAACSGATTDDVIAHQLGFLGPDTRLVTITVGGDNLGFTSTLEKCIDALHDSTCKAAVDAAVAIINTALPGDLKQVYGDILAKAPNAKLVVLGYAQLFAPDFCFEAPLDENRRGWINDAAVQLNQAIEKTAKPYGVFVPVDDLFAKHRVCSDVPWLNGVTALKDAFHPNLDGYTDGYLKALDGAVTPAGARNRIAAG